jgi:crossover junction endodeoxyribonuclease RuvC
MVKILGIDPGTATTGWAIIKSQEGKDSLLGYGYIETDKNNRPAARLWEIARDLKKIIKRFQPDEAAIEELFFFKNLKTVMAVSQSRGVVLLTLEDLKVKIAEYTPLEVKQALTGYGRAEKKQVQFMVKNILGLKVVPRPDDVADAIAIALCHSESRQMKNLIN